MFSRCFFPLPSSSSYILNVVNHPKSTSWTSVFSLAIAHGLWELRSLTREWTQTLAMKGTLFQWTFFLQLQFLDSNLLQDISYCKLGFKTSVKAKCTTIFSINKDPLLIVSINVIEHGSPRHLDLNFSSIIMQVTQSSHFFLMKWI